MTRGMREIHRVTRSGVVDVVTRLVGDQPVIAGVVDSFEGQSRPEFVALGGVVVDDVEYHFDARIVIARDHLFEFLQRRTWHRRIARIGREETDRVVAPIVGQAFVQKKAIVDEGKDSEAARPR